METNYYWRLGLENGASIEDVKSAFRKRAMKLHPDAHQDEDIKERAEWGFNYMNEAYEILGDPDKKREYDKKLENLIPETDHSNSHFENNNTEVNMQNEINKEYARSMKDFNERRDAFWKNRPSYRFSGRRSENAAQSREQQHGKRFSENFELEDGATVEINGSNFLRFDIFTNSTTAEFKGYKKSPILYKKEHVILSQFSGIVTLPRNVDLELSIKMNDNPSALVDGTIVHAGDLSILNGNIDINLDGDIGVLLKSTKPIVDSYDIKGMKHRKGQSSLFGQKYTTSRKDPARMLNIRPDVSGVKISHNNPTGFMDRFYKK